MMRNRGRGIGPRGPRRPAHTNFLPGGQIHAQSLPLVTPSLQQQHETQFARQSCQPVIIPEQISVPMKTSPPQQQPQQAMDTEFANMDNLISLATFKEDDVAIDSAQMSQASCVADAPASDSDQQKDKAVVNPWSKKHRMNKYLHKVKPKSSMAILNEIYFNVTYDVTQDEAVFKAVVTVNNQHFSGVGRNKAAAQTAAAEEALKSIVLSNREIGTAQDVEDQKPGHAHLLSFALYKLLNSWDDTGNMVNKVQQSSLTKTIGLINPTKKFPANPEKIHPVMLLSQTNPHAEFKETAYTPPPNCSFTIQCVVEDQIFTGTGTNKKEAKKMAAMNACKNLLGVKYEDHSI